MAIRKELPQRRYGETFELKHGGQKTTFAVTVGYYTHNDVRVENIGEVFISGGKAGSEVDAVSRDGAVLLSIALQFGVPLTIIQHALTREANGTASTIIGAVVDMLVASSVAAQSK